MSDLERHHARGQTAWKESTAENAGRRPEEAQGEPERHHAQSLLSHSAEQEEADRARGEQAEPQSLTVPIADRDPRDAHTTQPEHPASPEPDLESHTSVYG